MPIQIDVKGYASAIQEEFGVIGQTLNEKGAKRFQRALIVAGVLVLGAYVCVYLPPQQKSARLQAEIDAAKKKAADGLRFKDLRDQLVVAYAGLPALSAREQWLSNSVRDSLLVGGLETESFKPVTETEIKGLIFQNSSVTMTLRFAEFYDWLLRVENAKPLMHVENVTLQKNLDKLGFNEASCEIATVIPKKRFQ